MLNQLDFQEEYPTIKSQQELFSIRSEKADSALGGKEPGVVRRTMGLKNTSNMPNTIALIAHDRKKDDILTFVKQNEEILSQYKMIATGNTGQQIKKHTDIKVNCLLSGAMGGDVQIAALVAIGKVAAVIFLIDPFSAQPHEPDIRALLRICEVHDIPLAINLASARAVIKGLPKNKHFQINAVN